MPTAMPDIRADALSLLKRGRDALKEDIEQKRRYDFNRIFKYEDDLRVLSIVFEQYFLEWITGQIEDAFRVSPSVGAYMVGALSPLLEERLRMRAVDLKTINEGLPAIFSAKIKALGGLLQAEDVTEEKLNRLAFTAEQENALFKRLWKSLEEKP